MQVTDKLAVVRVINTYCTEGNIITRKSETIWILTKHKQELLKAVLRRVPLVEQELLTLPGHLSSPPVFSRVRVTRSLILCVCFVDRCLSFWTFSFDHCVVCSSSIYGFRLSLWHLQTLLTTNWLFRIINYWLSLHGWDIPFNFTVRLNH